VKISFNTISYRFSKATLFEIIKRASNWGYDGVEIWEPHFLNVSDLQKLKAWLLANQIETSCIVSYEQPNMICKGKHEINKFESFLACIKYIGCKRIRIFAGAKSSILFNNDEFKTLINSLKLLSEICSNHGIQILIETHHDTFADNIDSTIKLFEELSNMESHNIFCLLDIANLLESTLDSNLIYLKLRKYTRHLHLKNANLKNGVYSNSFRKVMDTNILELPLLKQGIIDYDKILLEVKNNSNVDWLTLEWFGERIGKIAQEELKYIKSI